MRAGVRRSLRRPFLCTIALWASASMSALQAPPVGSPALAVDRLSVPFVSNRGQIDSEVAFYAPRPSGTVFVTKRGEIVYGLRAKAARRRDTAPENISEQQPRGWSLTESFLDGNPRARSGGTSTARVSSFVGRDPKRWRSNLGVVESVDLGEVWRGIHVELRARGSTVEKVFTLAPEASVAKIRVQLDGARSLRTNSTGELVATTGLGDVVSSRPIAYQTSGTGRIRVEASYHVKGAAYGFLLGPHDPSLCVTIDPILQASYLGGSGQDYSGGVAINPTTAEVLVTGRTTSIDFPGTSGGPQKFHAPGQFDVFVARFDPTLTALRAATYLGGSGNEDSRAITVDPGTGEVYVVGETSSSDFPGTTGAGQSTFGGGIDAFIARYDATLTTLLQATYLGGSGWDSAFDVSFHPTSGELVVAGFSASSDFPKVAGGAQPSSGGGDDAIIARVTSSLTQVIQSTYFGGRFTEAAFALAIHPANGEVVIAGRTTSDDLPGTTGGAQPGEGGGNDAFAARFNAGLTVRLQSTYLGGSSEEYAVAMAVHPTTGDILVGGSTVSSDFPKTAGGAQPAWRGGNDGFIARLNLTLTTLLQATYLGGSNTELLDTILIRRSTGEVIAAGSTDSIDFPGVAGGAQSVLAGDSDAFAARLDSGLSSLHQVSFFGGGSREFDVAAASATPADEIVLAGWTLSTDLPRTAGGAQPDFGGDVDAFVARLTADLAGASSPTAPVPTLSPALLGLLAVILAAGGLFLSTRNA